jgi:hypothetical protein
MLFMDGPRDKYALVLSFVNSKFQMRKSIVHWETEMLHAA